MELDEQVAPFLYRPSYCGQTLCRAHLPFESAEMKHLKMCSILASDSSRGIHLARQMLRIKLRPIAPDGEENSV
jgi:hypothetical protein